MGWANPAEQDFRIARSSPYARTTLPTKDGKEVGVDMDELEVAQGKVSNIRVFENTSGSSKVGFLAPDSFACSVDWGTGDFAHGAGRFTRVKSVAHEREQSVALSGLPPHALIHYRINCAVQQPQGASSIASIFA